MDDCEIFTTDTTNEHPNFGNIEALNAEKSAEVMALVREEIYDAKTNQETFDAIPQSARGEHVDCFQEV